jgi:hypothetical protein
MSQVQVQKEARREKHKLAARARRKRRAGLLKVA